MSTGIAEQHLKSQQQANGSGNSDGLSESSVNYESWRSAAQPHQVFTPSTMSNVNSNYYYTTAAGTPIHYAPAASYIGNYNAVYTTMPPGPYYYSNGTPATGDYASVAQNHWNHYTQAPDNGKLVDSMQAMSLGAAPPVKKQPSWASIASQPAKPTVTTTLHVKKKGMPPPPMILNKLKLDPSPAPPVPPAPAPAYALPPPYTTLPQGLSPAHFLSTPPPHHVTVMSHPPPHLLSTPPPLPLQQTKDQTVECSEPYPQANSERSNCDNYINEGEYHEDPSGAEVGDASRCYEPDHTHQDHHETLMQHRSPTPSAEPPSQHSQNLDRPERSPKAPQYDEETASNLLEELKVKNNYNPVQYELPPRPRFFVIKSYSEDDIHRSIKYEIWCSTDHGNRKLDQAFSEQADADGSILLFFSVNRSGHFCGVARMMSSVDYNASSSVWSQDKWKGQFKVQWIYVKDVPNSHLKNIILETNENRPVTYCRDTTEVPYEKGVQVLQKIQQFPHTTSIFDDFNHYEQKQMAESSTQHHNDKDNNYNKDDGGRNNSYGNSNGYNKMRRSDRGEWRDNNSSSGGNRRGGGLDYHHQSRSNNYHRGGYNENYQRNYNGSGSGGYYNRNSGGYQKGERDYHRGDRDCQKSDSYRDREYGKNEYHRDGKERDFSHVRDWKNERDFHPREFREQRDGRDYRDREIRRGRNDEDENDH